MIIKRCGVCTRTSDEEIRFSACVYIYLIICIYVRDRQNIYNINNITVSDKTASVFGSFILYVCR